MTRVVVDALGTWCPVPIRLLADRVATLAAGDEILLLADDPLIEVDLPAWCHERGHELVGLTGDGREWHGVVRLHPSGRVADDEHDA